MYNMTKYMILCNYNSIVMIGLRNYDLQFFSMPLAHTEVFIGYDFKYIVYMRPYFTRSTTVPLLHIYKISIIIDNNIVN